MSWKLYKNDRAEVDNAVDALVAIGIGIAVFFIVVSTIVAPVGFTQFQAVNRTVAGLAAGTMAGNIWDVFLPLGIVVLLMAMIALVKNAYK